MLPTYAKQFVTVNGLRLAYIDFGGPGQPILALHGHFGRAAMFYELAELLKPHWRMVALEQRGHGWSDAGTSYGWADYMADAAACIHALNLAPAIVIGHSLGGVIAFQLAARFPQLVKAMVILDIGAEVFVRPRDLQRIAAWPARFPTLSAVLRFLSEQGMAEQPFLLESIKEYADGWGFLFHTADMIASQQQIIGTYWDDWLTSACPALVLRGEKSWLLSATLAQSMQERRANTAYTEFKECGHLLFLEKPRETAQAIKQFLEKQSFYVKIRLPK